MELLFIYLSYFVMFLAVIMALGSFVYMFYLIYQIIKIDLNNWD